MSPQLSTQKHKGPPKGVPLSATHRARISAGVRRSHRHQVKLIEPVLIRLPVAGLAAVRRAAARADLSQTEYMRGAILARLEADAAKENAPVASRGAGGGEMNDPNL